MDMAEIKELVRQANVQLAAVCQALIDDDPELIDYYLDRYKDLIDRVKEHVNLSTPVIEFSTVH